MCRGKTTKLDRVTVLTEAYRPFGEVRCLKRIFSLCQRHSVFIGR